MAQVAVVTPDTVEQMFHIGGPLNLTCWGESGIVVVLSGPTLAPGAVVELVSVPQAVQTRQDELAELQRELTSASSEVDALLSADHSVHCEPVWSLHEV